MTKLMNKQQVYMVKMLALLLPTFTIGLLVGKVLRDLLYGDISQMVSKSPIKSASPAYLPSKRVKSGNSILACSPCSSGSGLSLLSSMLPS